MTPDGFARDIGPLETLFLCVTLAIAGIHLYLGLIEPGVPEARSGQFVLIGSAFLVGFLLRLTPLWQPVLYLLGAAFALFLGAVWLFGRVEFFLIGVLTGITSTVFIALALYLFVREESRSVSG
ncbi:hypothetical protein KM295_07280 [Natronomonas sp. F2-12]|uniref:Uncharacterized protein n=1 Tax=Natronomonas aquatica TaxID=2841590 RepID=A0A9R1CT28_9EURY|nr:hypothetical protein [Natronomonas aquatica]MCQ4333282.1 hypothetical protein [Natronomonas aquatica]